MILNTQPGLIALQEKREIHEIDDLYYYYREFFDATDHEAHLLGNEELFRTVIANTTYSSIWAEDHLYLLELNRQLIDIAWLYLQCVESENAESVTWPPPIEKYTPEFHYQYKSTYYFDSHSGIYVNQDKRPDPFALEKDYQEVIAWFKGNVSWLSLAEILNPHWLYQQVFEKRTYPEWLGLLDKWGEYTLLDRGICEKMDGGDVYDTYVLFQKLTEMAYLMRKRGMCMPNTPLVKYEDHDEYPSFLNSDGFVDPYHAIKVSFGQHDAQTLSSQFDDWMEEVLREEKTWDRGGLVRLHSLFIDVMQILEACWLIRNTFTANPDTRYWEEFRDRAVQPPNPNAESTASSHGQDDGETPILAIRSAFCHKNIGYFREACLDCYDAALQRKAWSIKADAVGRLRERVVMVVDGAYRILTESTEKVNGE